MTATELTAGEAARLLGVAPSTLRSYVKRGHLTSREVVPGRNLYPRDELEGLKEHPPRRTGRPPRRSRTGALAPAALAADMRRQGGDDRSPLVARVEPATVDVAE